MRYWSAVPPLLMRIYEQPTGEAMPKLLRIVLITFIGLMPARAVSTAAARDTDWALQPDAVDEALAIVPGPDVSIPLPDQYSAFVMLPSPPSLA